MFTVRWSDGKTFKLTGLHQSYLSFCLFWHGADFYEPLATLLARAMVRPGDTYLDVGANVGFHTLALAGREPRLPAVIATGHRDFASKARDKKMHRPSIFLARVQAIRVSPIAIK